MKYFNGTTYPETAKSAENDCLHLLACDNGTFTVSHKESGRVFFEMPTLLVGKDDSFSVASAVATQKTRTAKSASFDTLLSASVLQPDLKAPSIFTTKAMLTATLSDDTEKLSFTVRYEATDKEMYLRFPSGMYEPETAISSVTGEIEEGLQSKITLKDDEENVFSVSTDIEDAEFSVTSDGDVDVKLPSIAPVTRENQIIAHFSIELL